MNDTLYTGLRALDPLSVDIKKQASESFAVASGVVSIGKSFDYAGRDRAGDDVDEYADGS